MPSHRSLYSHSSPHTPRAAPGRLATPNESAKTTRESSLRVAPPSPAAATPRTISSTHATPRTTGESAVDITADVHVHAELELEEEVAAETRAREVTTPQHTYRRAGERERRRLNVAPLSTSRGRLEHTPFGGAAPSPLPAASPSQRFFLERAGQLTARERPMPLSPQPSLAQMRGSPRVLPARVRPIGGAPNLTSLRARETRRVSGGSGLDK